MEADTKEQDGPCAKGGWAGSASDGAVSLPKGRLPQIRELVETAFQALESGRQDTARATLGTLLAVLEALE